MNVVLFFGSFNPIHIAHIEIAKQVVSRVEVDQLWFVVSPQNPFKQNVELVDEQFRLEMVALACEKIENVYASDVEFELSRPSYTIDTLNFLKKKFPEFQFSILMGEDNVEKIDKWKGCEEILDKYSIYYFPRDGSKNVFNHKKIKKISAPKIKLSSTQIRSMIFNGENPRNLLPNGVLEYIKRKKIFKK